MPRRPRTGSSHRTGPSYRAGPKPYGAANHGAAGGPGQVWVNTTSHVYHCQGDRYYGTTRRGSYMTEAAAKSAIAHADHGRACF